MKIKNTNRLAKEKSPYLLQHATNPVDWYPWGEEAFAKAKEEDKPILLSIGYSTCHWCHVMEEESFENEEIARVMNEHYVSIKVDREERPDIDNIYMSAVMAITGSGGWPLTVFLTADRKPFFGGTYFPPVSRWGAPGFKDLLMSIQNTWKTKRDKVNSSSQSLTEALQQRIQAEQTQTVVLNQETLDAAYNQLLRSFDARMGGFGNSPKFPMGHNLSFLLRYWKRSDEPQALEMVEKTLTEMANGGMYDHLGGGFHRYSTDASWHVPHFEKMLYDQAILARAYLEAYQVTKKPEYARVAGEIFDYVLRDMQSPDGGFYSAEDADSFLPEEGNEAQHKKEGAFYVWSHAEIVDVLGEADAEVFKYYYDIEPEGNASADPHGEFTGKNILHVVKGLSELAERFKKPEAEIQEVLMRSAKKLFEAREQRPRPHLDDKVLVDWNGLMISSLAFGSRVLNEPRYKEAAESSAQFILNNLVGKNGRLLHRYRDREAGITGTIEDYAFFVHGLIDLYEATFKAEYLQHAKKLSEDMIKFFWDNNKGGFFFTASDSEELILRPKEIYDGAIPSGNSVAALNAVRLAHITLEGEWNSKVEALLNAFSADISQRPGAYNQAMMAFDFYLGPAKEIVLAAEKKDSAVDNMTDILYKHFIPNKVVIFHPVKGADTKKILGLAPFVEKQVPLQGKVTAYVCENHVCKLPTSDVAKFEELIK